MVKVRLWYIWMASMTLALCFSASAEAGSRFEAGASAPVFSRASIDLTIVIPEFLRLGIVGSFGKIPNETSRTSASETSRAGALGVVGNGGTIVIATSFVASEPSQPLAVDTEIATVAYAVAMP
ncbi:MAG TPA: hypothetical protein PKN09_08965 [Novosphingobium sp.]|nr:hypothetical protein [Novosphingobium sp.]